MAGDRVRRVRASRSLVAHDDEALVLLELAAAVCGMSSPDQSLAFQAIPLVKRDLYLGCVGERVRLALRASAADRKQRSGLQLCEPGATGWPGRTST